MRACTAASRRRRLRRWRNERLGGGRSAGHTLHARRDRGGGRGRGRARRRCGLGALGGVAPRVVDGDAIEADLELQRRHARRRVVARGGAQHLGGGGLEAHRVRHPSHHLLVFGPVVPVDAHDPQRGVAARRHLERAHACVACGQSPWLARGEGAVRVGGGAQLGQPSEDQLEVRVVDHGPREDLERGEVRGGEGLQLVDGHDAVAPG